MRLARHTLLLATLVVVLLPASSARADGTQAGTDWPHGACRGMAITVTRVPNSEDRLKLVGFAPEGSCDFVRTNPSEPEHSGLKSGRGSFETILNDDALLCQSLGSISSDGPVLRVTADDRTDRLRTDFADFWHTQPTPASPGRMHFKMATDHPSAQQVVVALGSFERLGTGSCSAFPQEWTGSVVFSDPDRSALPLPIALPV